MKKHHYAALAVFIGVAAATGLWLSTSNAADSGDSEQPKVDVRRFKSTAIELMPPEIPEDMRLPDRAAEITAKVLIRPDGTVSDVSVMISHIPAANDMIIEACKKWRFEPAGIEQEMMYHTRVPPRAGTN